ncbi:kynurenine 3-monooxygenase [Xylariaceae sp. FL1019]|nr:kynurenine 3-monooxygenase [Xylariaceae sp. FL1019]
MYKYVMCLVWSMVFSSYFVIRTRAGTYLQFTPTETTDNTDNTRTHIRFVPYPHFAISPSYLKAVMASSPLRVAIVGGGLAGMATALALNELSIHCVVFEMRKTNAAPPLSSGALMLSPNSLRILERFGIYQKLLEKSYAFEYVYYKNAEEETIDRYPLGNEELFGYKALRVYRQELLDLLYEACYARNIPIHFNKKFSEVVEETPNSVTFGFADGTTETASLLIGADGIHSKIRNYVTPGVEKNFIGLTALTWEVPTSQLRIPSDKDYVFPTSVQTANGTFVLAPQKPDGAAMLAGTQFPIEELDRDAWDKLFADKEGLIERARKNIDVWPDIVQSSMENIKPDTLNLWAFYAIPRLENWTSGMHRRVVILGDAAHAIPPTTGQGASQAFEDASTLALMVSALSEKGSAEWEEALQCWQKIRQDRIDDLLVLTKQLNNKRLPPSAQASLSREELWTDESAENPRQMAWLYDPKTEDIVKEWIKMHQ